MVLHKAIKDFGFHIKSKTHKRKFKCTRKNFKTQNALQNSFLKEKKWQVTIWEKIFSKKSSG